MKKKKLPLKLNKKVVSELTSTKVKGGGTSANCPSAYGSCFVNCGDSGSICPECQPSYTCLMNCYR